VRYLEDGLMMADESVGFIGPEEDPLFGGDYAKDDRCER
jgi:hypothetical protein